MSYTEQFTETHDVLAALAPTAANAAVGTHNSGWVSHADYHRSFVWLHIGETGVGSTIDVNLTQATDALGTGAKALTTITGGTKSPVQIVAANQGNYVGIEVRSEEFDVTNGFVFLNVAVVVAGHVTYYSLVVFGIVSRYEPVGVTDFQEVVA